MSDIKSNKSDTITQQFCMLKYHKPQDDIYYISNIARDQRFQFLTHNNIAEATRTIMYQCHGIVNLSIPRNISRLMNILLYFYRFTDYLCKLIRCLPLRP